MATLLAVFTSLPNRLGWSRPIGDCYSGAIDNAKIKMEVSVAPNSLIALVPRLAKKAFLNSSMTYRVCAIAFTKRGNIVGIQMNGHRVSRSKRRGDGLHAEAELIRKFGRRISTIYILRVGNAGDPLPIHPCENCSKIAAKLGIKRSKLLYP